MKVWWFLMVHIVYILNNKVGVAKHSWVLWQYPLPLCPYEALSKVGNYGMFINLRISI